MGSDRGVATFLDVETFSTIQRGYPKPCDLLHYVPNQIFNSLRDGGISKRNFLETQEELGKENYVQLLHKGERGERGACHSMGIESLGHQGMGCSHIYSFSSLHLLIAI